MTKSYTMKKLNILLIVLLSFLASNLTAQNDYRILLRSGKLSPPPNLENFISEQFPSNAEIFNGYYYRFIQFNTIPNSKQKKLIASTGIKLLDYIPRNTFMAAIPVNMDKALMLSLNIRCVISEQPVQKIRRRWFCRFASR